MGKISDSLRQGSVIEAAVPAQRGKSKPSRPAIVISSAEEIAAGKLLIVVGVTTTPDRSKSADRYFPLRFDPAGNCDTGLRRECFAVVDWIEQIDLTKVHSIRGQLRKSEIIALLLCINRYDC